MAGRYSPTLMGDTATAWRRHAERLADIIKGAQQTLRTADGNRRTWHTAEADQLAAAVEHSTRIVESDLETAVERHSGVVITHRAG